MTHNYPINRISTKGRSAYQIYLDQRTAKMEKGYTLEPAMSSERFYHDYEIVKEITKNPIRSMVSEDVIFTKTKERRIERVLIQSEEPSTLSSFLDPVTGKLNLQCMSRKELYNKIKKAEEKGESWVSKGWEEMFYHDSVFY